jgi:hypothetical protein
MRFPEASDPTEVSDPMVEEGLAWATAAIDAAARKGGYTPVPFACPAPDIIGQMAAELAAGWVMSRPAFSACTEKVPENAALWLKWAQDLLDSLALGELDLGLGVEDEGDGVGVLSSGFVTGQGERIKRFPRYQPPAAPVDPIPTSHPQYGPGYNPGRYGGYGGGFVPYGGGRRGR